MAVAYNWGRSYNLTFDPFGNIVREKRRMRPMFLDNFAVRRMGNGNVMVVSTRKGGSVLVLDSGKNLISRATRP